LEHDPHEVAEARVVEVEDEVVGRDDELQHRKQQASASQNTGHLFYRVVGDCGTVFHDVSIRIVHDHAVKSGHVNNLQVEQRLLLGRVCLISNSLLRRGILFDFLQTQFLVFNLLRQWKHEVSLAVKGLFIDVRESDLIAGDHMLFEVLSEPAVTLNVNDFDLEGEEVVGHRDVE